MEEREVGRVWEAGAENAVIDHGEVERRTEEVLAVAVVAVADVTVDDGAAHLVGLLLLVVVVVVVVIVVV